MPRLAKEPLRKVTQGERETLEMVSRGRAEAAEIVERARCILAVADGHNFEESARRSNRKSGYGPAAGHFGVARLVGRFNAMGLAALQTKRGAGRKAVYTVEQREQVLAGFHRAPDREVDGTGTWSLTTLQHSVRQQVGLEQMAQPLKRAARPRWPLKGPLTATFSRDTLATMLHEAGLTWQRNRTWRPPAAGWCETGTAVRTRKHGTVIVVDPDSEAKKN